MESKEQKHSFIIIVVLCALLLGVSLAYAVLSSTFTITFGKIGTEPLTWEIGFEPGNVTGIAYTTSNSECGTATVTTNTVAIDDIHLVALNDKCVYRLRVKNTGGVPAELSAIVPKTPTSTACDTSNPSHMICGNISYKLTSDDTGLSLLGLGNVVPQKTGIMDMYLVAEYTGTEVAVVENQLGGGFAVTFTQK